MRTGESSDVRRNLHQMSDKINTSVISYLIRRLAGFRRRPQGQENCPCVLGAGWVRQKKNLRHLRFWIMLCLRSGGLLRVGKWWCYGSLTCPCRSSELGALRARHGKSRRVERLKVTPFSLSSPTHIYKTSPRTKSSLHCEW